MSRSNDAYNHIINLFAEISSNDMNVKWSIYFLIQNLFLAK